MNSSASQSDIRIDAEGDWFYRGAEMTRRDIISLFYQNLKQDSRGRYFIQSGPQQYPVDVEDTAFVVWSLTWQDGGAGGDEGARVLLSDNTLEALAPETLRIGKDNVPYCRVKNSCFEARFSRASYYELAERLEHDSDADAYFIALNGRRYKLS